MSFRVVTDYRSSYYFNNLMPERLAAVYLCVGEGTPNLDSCICIRPIPPAKSLAG